MRAILLWLILLVPTGLHAQAVLAPPFDLKWGDSPETLVNWARQRQLDIHITIPGQSPEVRIFRIDSDRGKLPGSDANALEVRFLNGQLIEVAVHHDGPGVPFTVMDARLAKLKRQLTAEHGAFKANHSGREIEDDFVTQTRAYHHEPIQGLFLMIAATEVEDLKRERKRLRFSLIYRNDNLKTKIERDRTLRGDQTDR